jgi:hypothetical protein
VLLGFALAFITISLLRTAWVSETAYLTFRTVEHAAAGFGPRWNVAERVQVYDHPLWMLLLAGRLVTGELYFTALAICIIADRDLIENPEIAALYGTIRTVTRGPLWSLERWKAILALNTGSAGG